MKGRERESLLDQLENETKKKLVRRRAPASKFTGQAVSEEEVDAAVIAATTAFRKVLESAQ